MKLTLLVFITVIAVLEQSAADEKCNEEELKKCLSTLQHLLMNQFEGIKKGEKDLSAYCQTLEHEGECLKEASVSCKKDHPIISNLVSSFHAYLSQFCNDKSKMYMDIAPCFETHKAAFEKCFVDNKVKREESHLDDICKEMVSMQCVAKLSKEKCKDGEAFGQALEDRVKHLKSDVCSGAASLINSVWGVFVTLFTVLFLKSMK